MKKLQYSLCLPLLQATLLPWPQTNDYEYSKCIGLPMLQLLLAMGTGLQTVCDDLCCSFPDVKAKLS